MQNDNLSGSQQLLRNDDASERIYDPPAGISNDVGIAFLETESACGDLSFTSEFQSSCWDGCSRDQGVPRRASMQATMATLLLALDYAELDLALGLSLLYSRGNLYRINYSTYCLGGSWRFPLAKDAA